MILNATSIYSRSLQFQASGLTIYGPPKGEELFLCFFLPACYSCSLQFWEKCPLSISPYLQYICAIGCFIISPLSTFQTATNFSDWIFGTDYIIFIMTSSLWCPVRLLRHFPCFLVSRESFAMEA